MTRERKTWWWYPLVGGVTLSILALIAAVGGFFYFNAGLPNYLQLRDYQPPVLTQIYDRHWKPVGSFAQQRRRFMPIQSIPLHLQEAFLAAEDHNFYQHSGIDVGAILRAGFQDIGLFFRGKRLIGASTITQQVARTFLLSNTYSLKRKIQEAIMALKLERVLSKDRILELYLNQIYLGRGAYGVETAARTYFKKNLDQLTLPEMALLAALTKGPNVYYPYKEDGSVNVRAFDRRNWVLGQMHEDGFISEEERREAQDAPLVKGAVNSVVGPQEESGAFLTEVRRSLLDTLGYNNLYGGGLTIYTSYDPDLQHILTKAFAKGLWQYTKRHGYRGPYNHLDLEVSDWQTTFLHMEQAPSVFPWILAVVQKVQKEEANIYLQDGKQGVLPLKGVLWARKYIDRETVGPRVQSVDQILNPGDIILVAKISDGVYALRQYPNLNGGAIAMEPKTGRILAVVGGWKNDTTAFNRATQAERQIGSTVKPFVFGTVMRDLPYGATTSVLDQPIVYLNEDSNSVWSPKNYSVHIPFRSVTLEHGLIQSLNLVTIRLAGQVGIRRVLRTTRQLRLYTRDATPNLGSAIGAAETTLVRLVSAFSTLVNKGVRVSPSFVDVVLDSKGKAILKKEWRVCTAPCEKGGPPKLVDPRPQVFDAATAYRIVDILKRVPKVGTAKVLRSIARPMIGKTGTTNESRDAWYVGGTPRILVGIYVGFDLPQSLGRGPLSKFMESGRRAALPLFRNFFEDYLNKYLKDKKSAYPFKTPRVVDFFPGVSKASGKRDLPYPVGTNLKENLKTTSDVLLDIPPFPVGLY